MNIYHCICAAEKDIYNARSYLETGEALNRVCDEIYSSIMWAMQAWLLAKGHEPDIRNGWSSMQNQFLQLAPENIRHSASYCASQAVMLAYDREGGGPDYKEEPMPFERWKELLSEVIDKTETSIVAIEKEVGCTEEELIKLWLYRKNL